MRPSWTCQARPTSRTALVIDLVVPEGTAQNLWRYDSGTRMEALAVALPVQSATAIVEATSVPPPGLTSVAFEVRPSIGL